MHANEIICISCSGLFYCPEGTAIVRIYTHIQHFFGNPRVSLECKKVINTRFCPEFSTATDKQHTDKHAPVISIEINKHDVIRYV